MRGLAARFRLYPVREGGRSVYVRVIIFDSAEAYFIALPDERDDQSAGLCRSYRSVKHYGKGRAPRVVPIAADVFLRRDRLSIQVVTHELLHAAIAVARYFKYNFCRLDAQDSINEQEEWLVHVHSELCRLFMKRAIDVGLYTNLPVSRSVQHA